MGSARVAVRLAVAATHRSEDLGASGRSRQALRLRVRRAAVPARGIRAILGWATSVARARTAELRRACSLGTGHAARRTRACVASVARREAAPELVSHTVHGARRRGRCATRTAAAGARCPAARCGLLGCTTAGEEGDAHEQRRHLPDSSNHAASLDDGGRLGNGDSRNESCVTIWGRWRVLKARKLATVNEWPRTRGRAPATPRPLNENGWPSG
jgi:hypothetical protein